MQNYDYHGDDLGATYHKTHTSFRVWSPSASQIILVTYPTGNDSAGEHHPMKSEDHGVWSLDLTGDLNGIYYNYLVTNGEATHYVMDPYAKACGVNGERGMVIDLNTTNPEGWEQVKAYPMDHFTEAIIYELHIRDISVAKNSGIKNFGKYLGLTELGTHSPEKVSTGLSHLKELGITHVQLMPCYDFFTVDETKLITPEYNWGYDPQNYNVPEGSYASDPYHGAVRIREFKEMIKALKDNDLRVVLDVVYNHTYLAEDSHLNKLVPGYYYRQDHHGNFTNGSGCGNELATERFMVRKMIIDSVCYWAKEYKIDGFRFDLMGLMDIVTINEIRSQLNKIDPSIIMYGEGWTGGHSPLPDDLKAIKGNVHQLPGTGVFNDDLRDAVKGHVFFSERAGFVNGATSMENSVMCGIVGAVNHDQVDYNQVLYSHFPWANEPAQSINYASAHDNLTLFDKLKATNPDDSWKDLEAMVKMAGAIVLTSQGIPFLHAGCEFLRTKKGDYNSYRSPDSINQIDWARKAKNYHVFKYYQGLITLRNSHPGFRMRTSEAVKAHLRFLPMPDGHMIGYVIDDAPNEVWEKIVVIFNANVVPKTVKDLPGDDWVVVVDQEGAGVEALEQVDKSHFIVQPLASYVLVDGVSYRRELEQKEGKQA